MFYSVNFCCLYVSYSKIAEKVNKFRSFSLSLSLSCAAFPRIEPHSMRVFDNLFSESGRNCDFSRRQDVRFRLFPFALSLSPVRQSAMMHARTVTFVDRSRGFHAANLARQRQFVTRAAARVPLYASVNRQIEMFRRRLLSGPLLPVAERNLPCGFLVKRCSSLAAIVESRAIYRAFLESNAPASRLMKYRTSGYCCHWVNCHAGRLALSGHARGKGGSRVETKSERGSMERMRCLFITNYLNGSDFGGPAGRLTSKWRVRRSQ